MPRKRRSSLERRWQLAERVISCAEEVRNAQKPADLHLPQWCLIELSRLVYEEKYYWLAKQQGQKSQDYGRWPHL